MLWRKDDFSGAWPKFHTAMSPIVADGLCIVQLGKEAEGGVVAYDLAAGDQKWKWADEGPGYASPVVLSLEGTKMIVALTAKSIVGISAKEGKLLWQAPFAPQGMAYNAATPIVDGQTTEKRCRYLRVSGELTGDLLGPVTQNNADSRQRIVTDNRAGGVLHQDEYRCNAALHVLACLRL